MRRGELYLVQARNSLDPKKQRVFVVLSRQTLIDSKFSTVICAPVYSRFDGLSTQVQAGTAQGLKHDSSIHCDELVSLAKSRLTHYVGSLDPARLKAVSLALAVALQLDFPALGEEVLQPPPPGRV